MHRRVALGLAATAAALPALQAVNAPLFGELDTAMVSSGQFAPVPLARLVRMTQTAQRFFADVKMRELTRALPRLLGTAQASRGVAESGQSAGFDTVLADVNALASSLAIKLHEHPVAWALADRAMQAARAAGDPEALARARWRMAIAMRRAKHYASAASLAVVAAAELRSDTGLATPWQAGFCARLLCSAAYIEALRGRGAHAYDLIAHAREVIREFPYAAYDADGIDGYAMSVARVVGDFGQAVDFAARVNVGRLPDIERQACFYENAAISWWGRGNPQRTYQILLATERLAPQEVQLRPWAHRLTLNLLSCGSKVDLTGLRDFAGRIGVNSFASA